MRINGKNWIDKIKTVAAAVAILFAFGTVAHARTKVSPYYVNFGNEAVGSTSAGQTVTITNENRGSLTIESVTSSAAQFSFSGPTLPISLGPGETLTGSVTFNPSAAQRFMGALEFRRSNGRMIFVGLFGTGVSSNTSVAPSITSQPANAKITAGQAATFNVAATGSAPMAYQWNMNGAAISGATSSSYTTPAETMANNNAQFTVMVSNSAGNAMSNAAVLTVASATVAPSITTQPASQTVVAGKTASFMVAATGTAPMTYQWSKNGAPIGGGTSSSYTTLAETTADNNAKFTVAVSNGAGSVTSNAAVLNVTSATVGPSITTQPASQTVVAGKTASFSVVATGTAPMTYQWNKNGAAIGGATSSSYTTPAETTTDNNAQFTVVVSNSASSAPSNAAVLSVTSAAVAPSVTTQPVSQTVVAGKTASFTVVATGTAPMSYQWSKNGAAISGAISSSYTTPAETTADNNAQFAVVVSNGAGSATSNAAVLTVTSATVAPSITTQPASQTVIAGKAATFAVTASGTAPMTYQWRMNGSAIGGATSSTYTTPAETTANNNAQFTVVVSNSAGSATSNAATLTVNAASTLLLNSSATSLSFGNVNVSSTGTQTATLTNAGNSSVTISNVTVSGAGFNVSGVSSGLILTPGQTATLTATFTPATAGNLTGSVSVASNATNSPDSIALSGTGVATAPPSVALSWTPSTSTVVGYNTYSSQTSGGPYTKMTSAPVAATSYTDTAVKSGITYYFVVTSVNASNMESAFSTEASALVP